ncbi:TSUP family transporter [Nocardia sp. CDC159]|uniref:Probable membrane transporter protein n=1 Tax=Nocardia pulmonis TaxID=2951408 RepID=A0A9X2EC18_9NOCA|nr:MULTISPECIES: TSUP family transporter [Nocardia]MCM6775423.1 TSUP family transporter [Nocardia pulmonis]MCM6787843.1 TSUP family transporter [Nocardia sp. CDC159]
MDFADWAALVSAATAAGWVDAVVGGGGLIVLPTLFLVAPTIAPQTALGTNKIAAFCGTSAATVTFARRVPMRWRLLLPGGVIAALTSAAGSAAVGLIDRRLFVPIVMVVLVGVAIFVTLRPSIGVTMATHPPTRRKTILVVALAAGLIGCYDGLLGPGTGTFLIIGFATLLGTEFVRAAAMAKVINCGSNLGSLIFLGATGHVLWALGLAMAAGNIVGAIFGSRMALARGAGFVRAVLLVVVVAMVIRLGWQQFG